MHRLGQGESGGQTPGGGGGGARSGDAAQPGGRGGMCSLPDRNAYVGKEGGKGEEEEYIPSRTVNHAE